MVVEAASPQEQPQGMRPRLGALLAMTAVVGLNLVSAVVLKTIADRQNAGPPLVAAVVGGVVAINAARFVIWGIAHKRYPLSVTYPLTSLFFPLMLGVSLAYGDPVSTRQVLGTALITIGVVWLTLRREAPAPSAARSARHA